MLISVEVKSRMMILLIISFEITPEMFPMSLEESNQGRIPFDEILS